MASAIIGSGRLVGSGGSPDESRHSPRPQNIAILLAFRGHVPRASKSCRHADDVKREVDASMRYRYSTKREQPNIHATEADTKAAHGARSFRRGSSV